MERCGWAGTDPENVRYHDEEWGRPVTDDNRLFEKLCLEGFQSGLSWLTILKKRPQFRKQFKNFDPVKVAKMTEADVERLLQDAGIVRHRGKIEAVINNARRAVELQAECGSLAAYFWRFEAEATGAALSKDLKKRGWAFVGPTTVYAFMQAMGLVNDHAADCVTAGEVTKARRAFQRPTPG